MHCKSLKADISECKLLPLFTVFLSYLWADFKSKNIIGKLIKFAKFWIICFPKYGLVWLS